MHKNRYAVGTNKYKIRTQFIVVKVSKYLTVVVGQKITELGMGKVSNFGYFSTGPRKIIIIVATVIFSIQ